MLHPLINVSSGFSIQLQASTGRLRLHYSFCAPPSGQPLPMNPQMLIATANIDNGIANVFVDQTKAYAMTLEQCGRGIVPEINGYYYLYMYVVGEMETNVGKIDAQSGRNFVFDSPTTTPSSSEMAKMNMILCTFVGMFSFVIAKNEYF